jgi:hypothetical protein
MAHRATRAALASVLLALGSSGAALADGGLGLYAGAAAGQATVAADNIGFGFGDFRRTDTAWKGIAGLRLPLGWAVEANYIDFGHPHGSVGGLSADVRVRGSAGFAMLFLPVPVIDLYLKAGVARLQVDVNAFDPGLGTCTIGSPNCARYSLRSDRTVAAGGAGAQLKVGALAVRAEYERYNETAGNPALLTVGVLWTFL